MALSEYSLRLLGAYAEQPFLMAPMAGVTDPAYRIMCRRRGANLAYSEMVSVAGLAYASNKTWRLVLPADEEQQICVQLFGSKPDQFASAVAAVEERVGDRLSLIDINMACPARKVVTKGEGSALMRTPDLAEKIVEAAVGAAHVPVTVKIRKGFYAEDRNAATFAQMLEGAGAAAVAVHGRCATQLYTGQADWSVVDEVADAVEIPVIGSGDVFSAEDAAEHLHGSGASAVFIARGIYGNPWVFGDARALALDGIPVPVRSSVERLDALRERIKQHGLRNSLIIAIAPTATIASIAGCYECVEPQVSNLFKRETLSGDFVQINRYLVEELKKLGLWTAEIRDEIKSADGSIQSVAQIPETLRHVYRTAWEMPMRSLIDMAADRGAFIDQGASLNLFMENPNIGALSSMYMYAWKQGIKTCYYLRSRPATKIAKTTVSSYTPAEAVACSLEAWEMDCTLSAASWADRAVCTSFSEVAPAMSAPWTIISTVLPMSSLVERLACVTLESLLEA